MNPIVQKLQSWQKHKKATSTFHHINYHYPQDYEKQRQKSNEGNLRSNVHKRTKSFSRYILFLIQRDSYKRQTNHEYCVEKNIGKHSDQLKSQLLKPHKKTKNEKTLKQKKQDFIRDYIQSESEFQKDKKKDKTKVQLKPLKSSPDNKSHSKSGKKLKRAKEQKSIKLKDESHQKKHQSKQISRQKTSKDSKVSKNSKHRKSQHLSNVKKINIKRQMQNQLSRQKKAAQINFKNISLKDRQINSEQYPMTPEQVAESFSDYFNDTEINEMNEYKHIYFLGRGFEMKEKNIVHSARQSKKRKIQNEEQSHPSEKNHHYFETENGPLDKNPIEQSEDTSQFYKYSIGSHIGYRYQIISSINRGSFGEVLKVFDHKTKEFLAIKIVKKSKQLVQQTFVQISILTHIKQNDKGNTSGIVRIKDFLLFKNHICIIFQLLDGNLYELLTENGFKGLNQDVIRLFAVQILNSLNFLKREKIIHCDMKPQNLVMKNWGKSGIKLIDFGTSCYEGKQMYSYLQSRYYRAPEVFMQMPYSYPIDMWSFGCMMAEFKIGEPLFSGRSSIQQIVYICSCIGVPNKNDGLFSLAFLESQKIKEVLQNNYLGSNEEKGFNLGENAFYQKYKNKLKKQCMINLEQRLSKKGPFNHHFLDFLQKILVWQPDKRLTPEEALRHPWITKGLSSEIYSLYSSFNTSESCSRSKKNSKDSKTSNQSKPKSSRQNSKKAKKNQIIQAEIHDKEKKKQENKINFSLKKSGQQEIYLDVDTKENLEAISQQKRSKLSAFLHKKDLNNLNRLR